MSVVKTNSLQLGQSLTATNNFTWYQPATPDGTVRLGNGNSGSVTDLVTLTSAGALTLSGALSVTGNTTIGDAAGDTLTINGTAVSCPNNLNFDSNTLFIDAANNKVAVGTINPSVTNASGISPLFVASGVGVASGIQSVRTTTPGGGGGHIVAAATRGSDANTYTALQLNDGIGTLGFYGADGTQFVSAAAISAAVDSVVSTNNVLGRLSFGTSSGGANSVIERMRLDSSGNLGLGVTPSAWGGNYKAFQVGGAVSVSANGNNGNSQYANNTYFNSSNAPAYLTSSYATAYIQTYSTGQHQWYTAPSGTAGAAISFTQAMTLDASGNLGVGTSSPSARVTLKTASAGTLLNTDDGTIIGIVADTTGTVLTYGTYTSHPVVFKTANSERARIDSSGNLLVGTTSAIGATNQTKSIQTSCGSPTNRVTNGLVQQSYGSSAGLPFVVLNTIGSFLGFGVDSSAADNTLRFATVTYDGNGMYWGATYCPIKGGAYTNASDYRIKENVSLYEDGALEKVLALKPVKFNVIPERENKNQVVKNEVGFIAHELQEYIPEVVYGEKDAVEEDGRPKHQAVDYAKLTAVLVKAIQELSAELNELKKRIN